MRKKLKGLFFPDSPGMPGVCLSITKRRPLFISVMLSTSISLNLNEYRMPTSAVSDEHYT